MTKPTAGSQRSERPMRADARRNRERLLAAATDAFVMHGVDASLDDIAREAGVGSGTLYRHFPTREALMEAVYRDQVQALCDGARPLLDLPDPVEALARWVRRFVQHFGATHGLATALMDDAVSGSNAFALCKLELGSTSETLLLHAKQHHAIRPDLDPRDLMRLVHGIAVASEKSPDPAATAERLIALMMDGLRVRDAPETGTP